MILRSRHALTVVAIAALAILAAACTSTVAGAGKISGIAGTSTGASSSGSSSSSSSSGGQGSPNWITGVNFATLPHADLGCNAAGLGGRVNIGQVIGADLTGDGVPEAVVKMQCAHAASEWPDSVYVYSDTSGTPTVIGRLLRPADSSYATNITTSGHSVTIAITTWSRYAPGCCPDLHYLRTFTWNGSNFSIGDLVDVVGPCGDTAFTVTAGGVEGATGHSSVVLRFTNRLPQACTVRGYPGFDAISSGGGVLAHASRTLSGFAGGAHSVSTITVGAGQTASALAEWLNFDPGSGGSCTTSTGIQVTPPNTSATASLTVQVTTCNLQIHPTVSGTTGNG